MTTLAFMHHPSHAYLEPWSGQMFGEGGVEKSLPRPTGASEHSTNHIHGDVIMPKLGNETAKCALFSNTSIIQF